MYVYSQNILFLLLIQVIKIELKKQIHFVIISIIQ